MVTAYSCHVPTPNFIATRGSLPKYNLFTLLWCLKLLSVHLLLICFNLVPTSCFLESLIQLTVRNISRYLYANSIIVSILESEMAGFCSSGPSCGPLCYKVQLLKRENLCGALRTVPEGQTWVSHCCDNM